MMCRWFPALAAALVLAGCSPDRTLESLLPADALAVALVDHPDWVAAALGNPGPDVPWSSLDPTRPWAATVEPADPPGFRVMVALSRAPGSLEAVQAWARSRGGMETTTVGPYAVLSSPGLRPLAATGPRFDLSALRREGDPIGAAVNLAALRSSRLPETLRPQWLSAGPGADLAGLLVGLNGHNGGLELKLATQWSSGSPTAATLRTWTGGSSAASWAPALPPTGGLSAAGTLPAPLLASLSGIWPDPGLRARWRALVPSLGPRWSLSLTPKADGTVSWSLGLESNDPQAVRQALKALVAGGALQKQAGLGAFDPDLPVIYQDRRDGLGGIETVLTVGEAQYLVGYGSDRVAVAGGAGKDEGVRAAKRGPDRPSSWASGAPAGALVLAGGAWDGLAAQADLTVRTDGNLDLRFRVDQASLKAWEERLPQVLLQWVSGEGGLTRFEP